MTDFVLTPNVKKDRSRPEAAALNEVLRVLRAHPNVAWCRRMNSGAVKVDGRFVRFGFVGCPDVLGQLRNGLVLAVECKSRTGRLREEQAVFLDIVSASGGCAFVARNARDVLEHLKEFV